MPEYYDKHGEPTEKAYDVCGYHDEAWTRPDGLPDPEAELARLERERDWALAHKQCDADLDSARDRIAELEKQLGQEADSRSYTESRLLDHEYAFAFMAGAAKAVCTCKDRASEDKGVCIACRLLQAYTKGRDAGNEVKPTGGEGE